MGNLSAEDIYDKVRPYLKDSVRELINQRAVNNIVGADFVVKFLAVRGYTDEEDDHYKKLAEILNKTCSAYQVKGSLLRAIKFPLLNHQAAYLSYIAFTPEAGELIDRDIRMRNLMDESARAYFLNEGECPKECDNG